MYRNILVATDGSPTSSQALREATRLAAPGVRFCLVAVAENPVWSMPLEYGTFYDADILRDSLRQRCTDILEQARQDMASQGIEARTLLVDLTQDDSRNVPQAILGAARNEDADLIVLGTHGRSGFSRLLMGSVTERLVRMTDRPVLLVRGAE